MALFPYTIDETSVGSILDPADGFLTELRRTQAPPPGTAEAVEFSASKQCYVKGQFVLRASRDHQNLISIGPTDIVPTGIWAQAASIAYVGDLQVVCVPKGSTWSLTLSDTPIIRPPRDSDKANYGDFPSWRHSQKPALPRDAV